MIINVYDNTRAWATDGTFGTFWNNIFWCPPAFAAVLGGNVPYKYLQTNTVIFDYNFWYGGTNAFAEINSMVPPNAMDSLTSTLTSL